MKSSNTEQTVHRSGPLKQDNKRHKMGRHRSNRTISVSGKKSDVKSITKNAPQLKRHERRNQIQQLRKQKRDETFMVKRSLGGDSNPPILVAILDLNSHANVMANNAIDLITSCDANAQINGNDRNLHLCVPRFKSRYEFITIDKTNLFASLDTVKVSDILLLIHPINESDNYSLLLDAIYGHCLPTTVHAVNGLNDIPIKKRNEIKKSLQKRIDDKFPNEKLKSLDSPSDALQLMNHITNCRRRRISFRLHRPQVLAEKIQYEPIDSNVGTLKVSGYVRNCSFDVNSLVHIPGYGDFQMSAIESSKDPYPLNLKSNRNKSDDSIIMESESIIIQKADPALQQSLISENIPDPMEGEQTMPTPEELAEAKQNRKTIKMVPKGTSEYQAAWILEDEDRDDTAADEDKYEDDDSQDDDDAHMEIHEESNCDDEEKSISDDDDDSDNDDNDSDYDDDDSSVKEEENDADEDIDMTEEVKMMKKFKEQRMNEMFPDEIDTPMDIAARVRFARFRGLKSFRTSHWDPKENLPHDYARIFQFDNFARTKKRIFNAEPVGAHMGWYVTVHIKNVPQTLYNEFSNNNNPLLIHGLLPHEQKMSVINLIIKKHSSCTDTIKSKEKLIFHLGCRRFSASPVFSAHTNGDKHKMERFLNNGVAIVATLYAPITFPPASVLVFKEDKSGTHKFVATGSLLSCEPNRIITKRIILSGHPFKINMKTAVVRYMFFNREDIMWFKPIELRTKYGRKGHIKEPLGTHGHMKCTFDKQLKSQDTVLMNLYKRIYPKWTYNPIVKVPVNYLSDEMSSETME